MLSSSKQKISFLSLSESPSATTPQKQNGAGPPRPEMEAVVPVTQGSPVFPSSSPVETAPTDCIKGTERISRFNLNKASREANVCHPILFSLGSTSFLLKKKKKKLLKLIFSCAGCFLVRRLFSSCSEQVLLSFTNPISLF